MNYPGGKNGSGVYQRLINLIPPHSLYVEAFLGSGPIMRLKRPAPGSIGIDADGIPLSSFPRDQVPNLMLIKTDAVDWLTRNPLPDDAFVYLDPPYLKSVRSSKRDYYDCEFGEPEEHAALLDVVRQLKCRVMISGYYSDQYAEALAGWRTVTFKSQTRSGKPATEWVWLNFPEPFELHDYRFLGDDFRERQDLKRQQQRWLTRLQKMNPKQRYAMLETIEEWKHAPTPQTPMPPAATSVTPMPAAGIVENACTAVAASLPLLDPNGVTADMDMSSSA